MSLHVLQLAVPASGDTGPGAGRVVRDLSNKTLQIVGGDGSWDVQISLNGTDYATALSGVDPGEVYLLEHACSHVRINALVNTTAPVVLLAGHL